MNINGKISLNLDYRKISPTWIVGFLLGIPVAYPNQPYYIGVLLFIILLKNFKLQSDRKFAFRMVLTSLLILIAILSNLVGFVKNQVDFIRAISTSFFFIIFLFPYCIRNKLYLIKGFCVAMTLWSLMIIVFAVKLKIFENGLLLFSVPELRLWGSEFFPDWPNYFSFMLAVAFLLNAIINKNYLSSVLNIIAAILTTSRTPLIAMFIFLIILLIEYMKLVKNTKIIMGLLSILIINIIILLNGINIEYDYNFLDRLLIMEDREEIYNFSLDLIKNSPLLGHGGILLDESTGFYGHPSFHNSYLDVAVRHGILALILFLILLAPIKINLNKENYKIILILLFFLIGSMFQNFLKHPHLLMLFLVIREANVFITSKKSE